jgi:starch synthase
MAKTPTLPRIGLILTEDAISMDHPKLMGRQSAGHGFLQACLNHASLRERITLVTPNVKSREAVRKVVQQCLPSSAKDLSLPELTLQKVSAWGELDVLHMPAPISSQQLVQRGVHRLNGLCLSGVTHTISSASVVQQLGAYVREHTRSSDALICTSQSVRTAIERLWHVEQAVLQRRFGPFKHAPALPGLPVIPLGIHTRDFAFNAMDRLAARTTLGFAADELVVLFVGRLSFHAKANPLALYRAASEAAKRTGQKVRILECGWFANDPTEKAFDEAAQQFGITVQRVDGRTAVQVQRSFAAADVFCSLSDNIQETFGLTPIEAMAAGLPCILSDWNGYRETAIHGEHGFLIKTQMPSRVGFESIEQRFADDTLNYDHYIGHVHALTSVDIESAAQALATLIEQPQLRQRMGQAGRQHVRQHFDWEQVIQRYDALWCEQQAKQQAQPQARLPRIFSSRLSPADLFGHYPSHVLQPDTPLYRQEWPGVYNAKAPASQARDIRQWSMWSFLSNGWLPSADPITQALPALHATQGRSIAQWGQSLKLTLPQSLRLAGWMIKIGLARSQPQALHSPQRSIQLICPPCDLGQRPDLKNLLTDERWVLHPADPSLPSPQRLAAQLQQIVQQGGHAVLLGPHAIVQDYWLAERLHDAWAQMALVQQLPHALAVRHDLLAQTCQSLGLLPEPPDLSALSKTFAETASAQGMTIGHWDMAIAMASPQKSAPNPSQVEST